MRFYSFIKNGDRINGLAIWVYAGQCPVIGQLFWLGRRLILWSDLYMNKSKNQSKPVAPNCRILFQSAPNGDIFDDVFNAKLKFVYII